MSGTRRLKAGADIKGEGGRTTWPSRRPLDVFVSRSTHTMVVDGATGKVLGDILNTPGVHGAGIATKAGHGFTTNGGDQTVTMFDLKTLAVIGQTRSAPGSTARYDEPDDKIILTNHSRPIGTLTAIDPGTGDIVATVELRTRREGAAADGKGHIFVNNESKNTMQVIDVKTWKATASWLFAVRDGPTGIVRQGVESRSCRVHQDLGGRRPGHRKVVASIPNGTRVDALGIRRRSWSSSRTEARATSPSPIRTRQTHTVVATVPTFAGAKTTAWTRRRTMRICSTRTWSGRLQ